MIKEGTTRILTRIDGLIIEPYSEALLIFYAEKSRQSNKNLVRRLPQPKELNPGILWGKTFINIRINRLKNYRIKTHSQK
jgi:type II restriction/modification system DNA methylase subunit YeeA